MPIGNEPKNTYKYGHLEEDEIRLLRLFPGEWSSELTGTLETYRLEMDDDVAVDQPLILHRREVALAPEYEAVSYFWGGGAPVTSLRISEKDVPYYVPIKENLRDGLKIFRAEIPLNEFRLFWIDAICINQ